MNPAIIGRAPLGGLYGPDRVLTIASVAAAVLYLASMGTLPEAGNAVVRGFTCGLLATVAFRCVGRFNGRVLGTALGLCAVGEVLMALDPAGLFGAAVTAYLAATLLLVLLFLANPAASNRVGTGRQALAAVTLAISPAFAAWLWPALGDLAVLITVYIVAISAMAVAALYSRFRFWPTVAGPLLILLADALLAIDRFLITLPAAGAVTWAAAYTGQLLLVIGIAGAALQLAPRRIL